MKILIDSKTDIVVRLERGELLVKSLSSIMSDRTNITGAWVQVFGGVSSAELGYYNLENSEYEWHTFDEVMEITSAQGSLAWKGSEPSVHLHICLSDGKMNAYGGHLKEAVVGGTCELLIRLFDGSRLTRVHDEASGLYLLDTE